METKNEIINLLLVILLISRIYIFNQSGTSKNDIVNLELERFQSPVWALKNSYITIVF